MTPEIADYRLNYELRGHEDDIRDILQGQDGEVLGPGPEQEAPVHYVEDSCWALQLCGSAGLDSSWGSFPRGWDCVLGMDTQVFLWDLSKGELMETMKGHQFQVTGLAVDDNGDIMSSSINW